MDEKKNKQLGMKYGTARNRLVKMLLFSLVKETGKDLCFRCGRKIKVLKELTIEHKEPWLDRSASLFWNLTNIAFSHAKCNVPHRQNNGAHKRRIIGPRGKAWCQKHRRFVASSKFYKNKKKWNGLNDNCKNCCKQYKENAKGKH